MIIIKTCKVHKKLFNKFVAISGTIRINFRAHNPNCLQSDHYLYSGNYWLRQVVGQFGMVSLMWGCQCIWLLKEL